MLAVALALVALAGCGSSENGVASKSGKEILAASKAAAESASSVHVVGKTSQGRLSLTINLSLASNGGRGQVSFLGLNFEVIRIASTVYVKGTQAFYKRLGAALGATLHVPKGTWLKAPAGSGPLAQLAAFADLRGELDRMLSTPGSVTKGASTHRQRTEGDRAQGDDQSLQRLTLRRHERQALPGPVRQERRTRTGPHDVLRMGQGRVVERAVARGGYQHAEGLTQRSDRASGLRPASRARRDWLHRPLSGCTPPAIRHARSTAPGAAAPTAARRMEGCVRPRTTPRR